MPDTYSGNYNFVMPEPGGSVDTWGTKLNSNWRSLDQILGQIAANAERALEGAPRGMLAFMAVSDMSMDQLRNPKDARELVVQPGWMVCNAYAIKDNSPFWNVEAMLDLRRVLISKGYPYGRDGDGHPRLPDARGMVLRAADLNAGVDPEGDRVSGSVQMDAFKEHSHPVDVQTGGSHRHTGTTSGAGGHSHSGSTTTNGQHSHEYQLTRARDDSRYAGNYFGWGQAISERTESGKIYSAGSHSHGLNINSVGDHAHSFTTSTDAGHQHVATSRNVGDKDETRMKNICFILCVRY